MMGLAAHISTCACGPLRGRAAKADSAEANFPSSLDARTTAPRCAPAIVLGGHPQKLSVATLGTLRVVASATDPSD